jgi:hypothetical protein
MNIIRKGVCEIHDGPTFQNYLANQSTTSLALTSFQQASPWNVPSQLYQDVTQARLASITCTARTPTSRHHIIFIL